MDNRITELERQWASDGDIHDYVTLYTARKRAGQIIQSPPGVIPDDLDGYGFGESFGGAGEEGHYMSGGIPERAGVVGEANGEPFTRMDVAYVIAYVDGEPDEDSWMCIVELHDGRFGYVEGGCDYTGFD